MSCVAVPPAAVPEFLSLFLSCIAQRLTVVLLGRARPAVILEAQCQVLRDRGICEGRPRGPTGPGTNARFLPAH